MIIDGCCAIGERKEYGIMPSKLLKNMDENNVDKAVIMCDSKFAAVDNRGGNEYVSLISKTYEGKFYKFATANPWFENNAVIEIEKCLSDGFNGVFFDSLVQGFKINDDFILPLLEICLKYSVPVYFNTGTPINAMPFQVMSLARRYPKLNFIIGHSGANDYIGDALASLKMCKNIYVDTSLTLSFTMRNLSIEFPERMIFGSSSPQSSISFELNKIKNAVINKESLNQILYNNIFDILGGLK